MSSGLDKDRCRHHRPIGEYGNCCVRKPKAGLPVYGYGSQSGDAGLACFFGRAARRFRRETGLANAGEAVGRTVAGHTRRGPGHLPAVPGPHSAHTAERYDARMLGARGSTSHVRRRRCRRGRPQATADQGLTGPSRRQLRSSCWRRQRNERERGSMLRTGRLPPPGSLCSALQRSPARGGSCARATGPQALLPPHSLNRFETTTRPRTFSTGIGPNWRLSREFH